LWKRKTGEIDRVRDRRRQNEERDTTKRGEDKEVENQKLKIEQKKVKDQQEQVKIAENNLELAREDLRKKRQEVDKLLSHKKDWEKEMRREQEIIEGREQDELGAIIHSIHNRPH